MPAPAGHKLGLRKTHSRPRHKGRARGSSKETAKSGSVGGGSGRRLPHHQQPSTGRHSSTGSSKPTKPVPDAPAKTDGPERKGSPQASLKDKFRRTSAQGSVGAASKQSVPVQPMARRRRADDEFSTRERRQIRARRGKVATAVCTAVLVVVVVVTIGGMAFMLAAPGMVKEPSAMRGFTLIANLKEACYTDDCRTAVARMNASIDGTVNPCDDVYQYACGRWRVLDDAGEPLSYEQSVRRQYVDAVHGNFTGGAAADELCRSNEPQAKMGCVYASCVAFYTNRSSTLAHLLAAANIDAHEWMHVRGFKALFTLMVHTIVKTHLPSVLSVTRRGVTTAVVETGTCLSCSSSDQEFTWFLLDQAVSIKVVDSDSFHRLSAHIDRLDSSLRRIVHRAPQGAPTKAVDVGLFNSLDKGTWQRALAGSQDLQLMSSNSGGVARVVAELRSTPLEAAKLYTLLAPLAQYVALEHFEAQRRTLMKAFTVRSTCVGNMAFLFTVPFDTAIAAWLGTEKAAVTFNSMWSNVRLAGVNALHLGTGFELDKEALETASIDAQETSGLNDPAFAEEYGDDFLANLILYQRIGKRHVRAADFRSDAPRKGGFLPTNYFLPDYYYGGATELTLNSGTLGALTAAMLFRMSLPKLASEPSSYVRCFAKYSWQSLKVDVDAGDWMRHTRARWVLEVSLAATGQSAERRREKALDALHYLRFARTYCGEEEADRTPLQFAVRSSANFNRTFECAYPYPPMAC